MYFLQLICYLFIISISHPYNVHGSPKLKNKPDTKVLLEREEKTNLDEEHLLRVMRVSNLERDTHSFDFTCIPKDLGYMKGLYCSHKDHLSISLYAFHKISLIEDRSAFGLIPQQSGDSMIHVGYIYSKSSMKMLSHRTAFTPGHSFFMITEFSDFIKLLKNQEIEKTPRSVLRLAAMLFAYQEKIEKYMLIWDIPVVDMKPISSQKWITLVEKNVHLLKWDDIWFFLMPHSGNLHNYFECQEQIKEKSGLIVINGKLFHQYLDLNNQVNLFSLIAPLRQDIDDENDYFMLAIRNIPGARCSIFGAFMQTVSSFSREFFKKQKVSLSDTASHNRVDSETDDNF